MYENKRDDVLDGFRRHLKVDHGLSEKTIQQHVQMVGVSLDRTRDVSSGLTPAFASVM